MAQTTMQELSDELQGLRTEVEQLKASIIAVDIVCTDEDLASLEKAEHDFKNHKTTRLI